MMVDAVVADFGVYQSVPLLELRAVNAILSVLAVPLILWCVHRSPHRPRLLYRVGVLLVCVGFLFDGIGMLGWLPFNAEFWITKNVGVILSFIAIWLDHRKHERAGVPRA